VLTPDYFSVKEAVFPFVKFPGVDSLLGPEMKSTGEVMGVGRSFGDAFAKALAAAGDALPGSGSAFISVRDRDKPEAVNISRELADIGFKLVATRGTADALRAAGIDCEQVNKVTEGRPDIVDMLKNDDIDLIVNTTEGKQAIADSYTIRRTALQHGVTYTKKMEGEKAKVLEHGVTYTTTMAGAKATVLAINATNAATVNRLQDLHKEVVV
jgi:carbamoyl-phosphate synthase large subunit